MGNLGWPEMIFIVIAALIIFGPRKLPEIARTLGGFMAQLRRASDEFKRTWETEVDRLDEADRKKPAPATISNLPASLAQEEVNLPTTDSTVAVANEIAIVPVAESVAKSAPNAAASAPNTAAVSTVVAESSPIAAAIAVENPSVSAEAK
jgi:sec-independent protein translocase protein TatB